MRSARLVPEFLVSDHAASRDFYVRIIGFEVRPYGRGASLQIQVEDLDAILTRLRQAGIPLFRQVEEAWYRADDRYVGNRQFLVQDPDGFLLRFFEDLGESDAPPSGRLVG